MASSLTIEEKRANRALAFRQYNSSPKAKVASATWYVRKGRAKRLKVEYGLTVEQHAAMLKAQGSLCKICEKAAKRLVVDHDHATGKVRGLLCDNCNHALGKMYDSPALLVAAANYLLKGKPHD